MILIKKERYIISDINEFIMKSAIINFFTNFFIKFFYIINLYIIL